MSVRENVTKFLSEMPRNAFGEQVKLVAAVKMQTAEAINEAIAAGVEAIGDNHVQEFREKYDRIAGAERHFIGHLQTNKVKYLIGKTDLYQSLDRPELAEELSRRSVRAGVASSVLVQVNIGCEESKGGYAFEEAMDAAQALDGTEGLLVKGYMAMLPISEDEGYLRALVQKMRSLYDETKRVLPHIEYLSMGMSGDWKLCVENGSNMIRIGTTLFGARDYSQKQTQG